MAAQASIKFRFSSPYKGGTKVWSTTCHVTGGDWQDLTHFTTFGNNVWAEWISTTATRTTLLDFTAYNGGSDLPVYTVTKNAAGTYNPSTNYFAPLESCILMKYTTDQRTSKNHPIYLFNYIHDITLQSQAASETPESSLLAAWITRTHDFVAGYSDGTLTRKRAGPNGAVAQSGTCLSYLTHRDFPN